MKEEYQTSEPVMGFALPATGVQYPSNQLMTKQSVLMSKNEEQAQTIDKLHAAVTALETALEPVLNYQVKQENPIADYPPASKAINFMNENITRTDGVIARILAIKDALEV